MEMRFAVILAASLTALAAQADPAAPALAAAAPAAHVYARLERAQVQGGQNIEIQAQLDAGGPITVLQAEDIKYAHGEGGMFVHFTIDNGRVMPGRTVSLSLPVLQDQHLRDRSGATDHRPIVSMGFCIGDHAFTTNVALQLRDNFNPQLLLGKADAAQFGALDPQKKNTIDPGCTAPAPPPKAAAQ
jgi:hypothetical protein